MYATHPDAVWLNVARSSPRTAATRRRLQRQFEFFDMLGNPMIIGLTDVHCSAVALWTDWASARGYHVVAGRHLDRIPTTALLLTDARRTVRGSQRIASTPRRRGRGWASWLEVQSVRFDAGRGETLRVGNTYCHTSARTAFNFFESCLDTTSFIIGGDFNLVDPCQPHDDRPEGDSRRDPMDCRTHAVHRRARQRTRWRARTGRHLARRFDAASSQPRIRRRRNGIDARRARDGRPRRRRPRERLPCHRRRSHRTARALVLRRDRAKAGH